MEYTGDVIEEWTFALRGDKKSFHWLMKNGFKELGAFERALSGSQDALNWLRQNQFLELFHMIRALSKETTSLEYLIASGHKSSAVLVGVVFQDQNCMKWMRKYMQEEVWSLSMAIQERCS